MDLAFREENPNLLGSSVEMHRSPASRGRELRRSVSDPPIEMPPVYYGSPMVYSFAPVMDYAAVPTQVYLFIEVFDLSHPG